MVYGDLKYLNRKTAADKVLRDKAFNIAKNFKYDGCQLGFASMIYTYITFIHKKRLVEQLKMK